MKCVCKHCNIEYENDRDYKTSICDECFKRFNENNVQPLKDLIHELQFENRNLLEKIKQFKEKED